MSPLSFFHKLSHAWKIIFTVNPFQLFSELGTKYNSGLCQKKKKNPFFSRFGINWEVQSKQPSKIPKSLCELRKTSKVSLRLTPKNPNLESTAEFGNVMSQIYIKQSCPYIKQSEWGISLPQILRIYQWIAKNMFSIERIEFWTHHVLERPRIKVLTIWCITQARFHDEQEAKFK